MLKINSTEEENSNNYEYILKINLILSNLNLTIDDKTNNLIINEPITEFNEENTEVIIFKNKISDYINELIFNSYILFNQGDDLFSLYVLKKVQVLFSYLKLNGLVKNDFFKNIINFNMNILYIKLHINLKNDYFKIFFKIYKNLHINYSSNIYLHDFCFKIRRKEIKCKIKLYNCIILSDLGEYYKKKH